MRMQPLAIKWYINLIIVVVVVVVVAGAAMLFSRKKREIFIPSFTLEPLHCAWLNNP